VKNEEVLHEVIEVWTILHTIKLRKAPNWIGYMLSMDCLLKRVIVMGGGGGKKEGTGRRGRRRKQLPNDRKETRR
jgi:hypothetical protein